jgi:hypothetical protein
VRPALIISGRDNVATALQPLEMGQTLDIDGRTVTVAEPIAPGHKVALGTIRAGEAVIKYGSPIGLASADIVAGAHVHTHNVASSRGRGDLPLAGARGSGFGAREPEETEALEARDCIAESPRERLRPERGAGGHRGEAAAPSESAWGWGPTRGEK